MVEEARTKIENLEERFIEEKINQELYEKFVYKFSREKVELLEHLQPTIINASNQEKYIEMATIRVTELASMWGPSNYAEKQRLQLRIFPEEIYYCNKKKHKPRTEKMNTMFAFVVNLTGVSQKEETRLSKITLKKSGLAGCEEQLSNQFIESLSEIHRFVSQNQ
ncbi:hypothetical protein SIO70_02935 [Chitinophaga sancti]|uniref:hypothetical protein n=1 Tax=Chitinophaga sancti TaxID=1004 RepID=UPI002A75FF83|nr:hypothetical protein [Chitinophaga sancti]WPQ63813.1 hypothetical protein SIO70_02935 [Chitinophaga sancti]